MTKFQFTEEKVNLRFEVNMSLGNNVNNYSSLFFFPHSPSQNEGDFCQKPLLCFSPITVHSHCSTGLSLPLNENEDFSVGKGSMFGFLENADPSLFNRGYLSIWQTIVTDTAREGIS